MRWEAHCCLCERSVGCDEKRYLVHDDLVAHFEREHRDKRMTDNSELRGVGDYSE